MEIYLVGGAVRDELLGLPVKEQDWVVVGATPNELLKQGYKPVGKDFPVFLHPETHDEYALARTERKTAKGYKGFDVYAAPEVTLEEDLLRRDLTVNAIAKATDGSIIDPFNGQQDLKAKILRHVSDAFVEDPVRVLRVARFSSKFGDFTIAPETMAIMKQIVANGEVNALTPERVWQELERALAESYPWRFIEILRECHALKIIFPEIDALFGVPNPAQYHPEVDTGIHTLLVLKEAVKLSENSVVRFAALTHDLGKIETPKEEWPRHYDHCKIGISVVRRLCERIHAPRKYQDLGELTACHHMHCHRVFELKPATILKLLKSLDPFRKPERFKQFLLVCEADAKGRLHSTLKDYIPAIFLNEIYQQCEKIDIQEIVKQYQGEQIALRIDEERLAIIKKIRKIYHDKELDSNAM